MGLLHVVHNRRLLSMLDSFRRMRCYEDGKVVLLAVLADEESQRRKLAEEQALAGGFGALIGATSGI